MWASWWPGGAKRRKCVPLRTHEAKKEPAGSPTLQKVGPRLKKTWKMMPRRCQKETRRQKCPRKMTRRSKNTPEHHSRAAARPKSTKSPQKKTQAWKNNGTETNNNAGDYPNACAFFVHKNKDPLHKKKRAFPPSTGAWCSRQIAHSSPPSGGPSSKFYIYIYIYIYIYRRLGGESDREILMVPVCVILSLGFGLGLVVRGAGSPSGWCLTLFCQIE